MECLLAVLVASFAAPARAASVLTGLSVGAEGARLALDGPAVYHAFRLSAPDRYVIDLPQTELGLAERSWPGAGRVRRVRAGVSADGAARIVFDLERPLAAETRQVAGALIVAFADEPAPAAAGQAGGEAEPAAPADFRDALAPLAVPMLPPAAFPARLAAGGMNRLAGVQTTPDGAVLRLALPCQPDVFLTARPPRLVIDLPGVRAEALRPAAPPAGGVVRGVRVGAFKGGARPVTRVVLDLERPARYSLESRGTSLAVTFEPSAPAAAASRTREYRGWIVDAGGRPLSGVFLVRFTLPDEGSLDAPRWTETLYADARGGRFASVLGRFSALPADALDPGIPIDAAPPPGVAWRVVPR